MRWFVRREEDLNDEIRSHIRMAIQDRVEAGQDPQRARAEVLREFGGVVRHMEDTRDVWGWRWAEQSVLDLRFAVRALAKAPAFAAAAILSLTVGIGATTALLSVLHNVTLRPFPFADPHRLAVIWNMDPRIPGGTSPASFPDWQDWRSGVSRFANIAAFRNRPAFVTANDQTFQLEFHEVSSDFLASLGIAPAMGRFWKEHEPQADNAAVISDSVWRHVFGSARDIIGRRIVVNRAAYTVVGVMPQGFASPSIGARASIRLSPADSLWTPLVPGPAQRNNRGNRGLRILARVQSNVTMESAGRELSSVAGRLADAYPDSNRGLTTAVVPLAESIAGAFRPPLAGLALAGGLFLLIACANVASLILARDAARAREFATRSALGAGRTRLLRQLLTEHLVLAACGGAGGLALAMLLLSQVRRASAVLEIPRLSESALDLPVLAAALSISLAAGLLFGLIPAWRTSRVTSPRSTTDRQGVRTRQALIGGVTAITFVLVFSATGLAAAFQRIIAARGKSDGRTYTFQTTLTGTRWSRPPLDQQFYAGLLERMRALPQVESAGVTTSLLQIGDPSGTLVTIEGNAPLPPDRQPMVGYTMADATYFRLAGLPLREGRLFDERDRANAPLVAVVNEAFVRAVSPDQSPLGRKAKVLGVAAEPMDIVGVVADGKPFRPGEPERPRIFYPYSQSASTRLIAMIRMRPGSPAPVQVLRAIVRELDPSLPVFEVQTVEAILAKATASPRWGSALVAAFAAMALVLASIGVAGVVGFVASRRSKECGIRLALGAAPGSIRWLVARQGVWPVAGGMVLGIACTPMVSRLIAGYMPGAGDASWLSLASGGALLALAGAWAAFAPARRATGVDPASVLRCD
jgi:predicted permease